MILESFEVENWSCIRRATVEHLPARGVVVLHAPNRTGKSSIVAALRAALFDFKPSSTDQNLKDYFPNWTSEPPRVRVDFRTGGVLYRMIKQFKKSPACSLEEWNGSSWSRITATPAEVHDRTLELVGGKNSQQGLPQLLWLEQANLGLPDDKKFDPDIQARLRGVLGVMQTPLDDAFLAKLVQRWKNWHTGSKPGPEAKRNKTSQLFKDLTSLEEAKTTLNSLETEYQAYANSLGRAEYLETEVLKLARMSEAQKTVVMAIERDSELAQARLNAFALAQSRVDFAAKEVQAAVDRLSARTDADTRLVEAQAKLEEAEADDALKARLLAEGQATRDGLRAKRQELRAAKQQTGKALADVQVQLDLLTKRRDVATQQEKLEKVKALQAQLQESLRLDLEQPAPTKKVLDELLGNRQESTDLQARLNAAAMRLSLAPDAGRIATVIIDQAASVDVSQPQQFAVQRSAGVIITDWGRLTLTRGDDDGVLDQAEIRLRELQTTFRESVARFGFQGDDPKALEHLRQRVAQHDIRTAERKLLQQQLQDLAKNPEALELELRQRETALQILESTTAATPDANPAAKSEELQHLLDALNQTMSDVEEAETAATAKLEAKTGLVARVNAAAAELAAAKARVETIHEELQQRHLSVETLDAGKAAAEAMLTSARQARASAELTDEERSLPQRLDDARATAANLNDRLRTVREELHKLQGALSQSAGLHQKRAEAAAAVAAFSEKTAHADREARSFHRLFELFEECRDKQTAIITAPITNRVLRWMRQAGISDYDVLECGPNFLPQSLAAVQASRTLPLESESAGAREMIALMVRLALGTVLVPPGETAVAVLDDPLTHCDSLRMDRMRAVLRSAAAGDPTGTPPAGPLQILAFTCHPERFQTDSSSIIDLGNPAILDRV